MNRRLLLGLVSTTLILTGCGGGGSGTAPEASDLRPGPRSISLTAIEAPAKSVYRKGEPLEIGYSIGSSGISAENVTVTFSLVPTSEIDLLIAGERANDVGLGGDLIEEITPGFLNRTTRLTIPNDIPGNQDYVILGVVDAGGVAGRDGDLEDNRSRGFNQSFSDPTTKVITVADEFINDLSIENAAVGEGFILLEVSAAQLDTPSASNNADGSNVVRLADDPRESNAVGHIDVRKLGAESMSAVIQVDVIVDGQETPAFMWKGEGDQWVNEAAYNVPSPTDVHFVPWDIRLSGAQREALFAAYDPEAEENTATFRFRIAQTGGALDENPDNNSFELTVPYRFFLAEEVETEESNLTGSSALTTSQAEEAASRLKTLAGPSGNRSPELFGFISFLKKKAAEIQAKRYPNTNIMFTKSFGQTYGDKDKFAISLNASSFNRIWENRKGKVENQARVDGYFFNNKRSLSRAIGRIEADGIGGQASYRGYVSVFGRAIIDDSRNVSTTVSKEWSRAWDEEKTFVDKTFFLGPVPINVRAGASGTMGFGAGLGYGNKIISAYGDLLTTELAAFASGGVNVAGFGGGIQANLLLIDHNFGVSGTADLSRLNQRRVILKARADNDLEAIKGKFQVFGSHPDFHFCCSFYTRRHYLTLYETPALFDKRWTLLNASRTVSF